MADKLAVTTEEGREAADALMAFFQKGEASLARLAGLLERDADAMRHGRKQEVLEAEASAAGLNPDLMKKAWRIAEQYTEEKIEKICRRVREKPARFGYSHLVKLLSVEDRKVRRKLLDQAIDGQWSVGDLQRALKVRTERRPDVGKKPKVPADPLEALLVLQGLCLKFNRYCAEALKALPRGVKEATREADRAVRNANAVASKRIKHMRNKREQS